MDEVDAWFIAVTLLPLEKLFESIGRSWFVPHSDYDDAVFLSRN